MYSVSAASPTFCPWRPRLSVYTPESTREELSPALGFRALSVGPRRRCGWQQLRDWPALARKFAGGLPRPPPASSRLARQQWEQTLIWSARLEASHGLPSLPRINTFLSPRVTQASVCRQNRRRQCSVTKNPCGLKTNFR